MPVKSLGLAVALALLAIAAGPSHAQAPARRVCDPENSKKAALADIAANPGGFLGACVRVDAIYANERLYADADAIYGLNPGSVGGYVDGQGDLTGFWKGTFTGRVADCARAEDDLLTGLLRSPGISLNYRTLGCLEPRGPFLVFMSQGALRPAGLTRRLPGARGGDLAPAPAAWEHRAEVEATAAGFIAALEAADRARLGVYVSNAYALEQLMTASDTAISALRTLAARESIILFSPSGVPDRFSSEACYCLAASCAGRWPIAHRDADNQQTRPYACLRIDGELRAGSWRLKLDASRDFDGLPEAAGR